MSIDYMKFMETEDWMHMEVVHAQTGVVFDDVVEANAVEGWFWSPKRDALGNLSIHGTGVALAKTQAPIVIQRRADNI